MNKVIEALNFVVLKSYLIIFTFHNLAVTMQRTVLYSEAFNNVLQDNAFILS